MLGSLLGGGLGAGIGLAGVGLKDALEGDKGEDDTGLGSYALGGLGGGALGALGGGGFGYWEGKQHDRSSERFRDMLKAMIKTLSTNNKDQFAKQDEAYKRKVHELFSNPPKTNILSRKKRITDRLLGK